MLIRHCVEESNVDDGQVLDPTKVRHVTIKGGKVGSLSGFIDPASHLNLDYPDHKVTVCVIAEKFSVGERYDSQIKGSVLQLSGGLHTPIMDLLIIHRDYLI